MDWDSEKKYVLEGINDLKISVNKLYQSIDEMKVDLITRVTKLETEMKLKSGFWGMLGGLIMVSVAILVNYVKK